MSPTMREGMSSCHPRPAKPAHRHKYGLFANLHVFFGTLVQGLVICPGRTGRRPSAQSHPGDADASKKRWVMAQNGTFRTVSDYSATTFPQIGLRHAPKEEGLSEGLPVLCCDASGVAAADSPQMLLTAQLQSPGAATRSPVTGPRCVCTTAASTAS